MSAPRCGFCGAPTRNGSLCKSIPGGRLGCWEQLQSLLQRCIGIDSDLESAVGKRGKHGEVTFGSSAPGLPINADAMDVRRDLLGVLYSALGHLDGPNGDGTATCAARIILSRPRAVLASSVAPRLLGDLLDVVPRAVAMTDKPRAQPGVQAPCPRCGHRGRLRAVMGLLECSSCRERMTVGEVRSVG